MNPPPNPSDTTAIHTAQHPVPDFANDGRLVIAVLFELPADWTQARAFDNFTQRLRTTGVEDQALFCSPPLVATEEEVADPSFGVEVTSYELYAERKLEPASESPQ
jgi:hypothetical protein